MLHQILSKVRQIVLQPLWPQNYYEDPQASTRVAGHHLVPTNVNPPSLLRHGIDWRSPLMKSW